jgi:hypothetical protein
MVYRKMIIIGALLRQVLSHIMNTTTICDVHVNKLRSQPDVYGRMYSDLKDWMSYPENVYIARQGIVFVEKVRWPPRASIWANPYKLTLGRVATGESDRKEVLIQYRKYIIEKIKKENLYDELLSLKGKTLGCWCAPNSCHGDVLIDLINIYEQDGVL